MHLTFVDLQAAHPSGSKLHPQPFSLGRREPEFKVPLPRERDLGFDVSAQPNGEGGSGGYKTGMHPFVTYFNGNSALTCHRFPS